MAKLIIRNQAGEDREFPLADRDLRIGRNEQNDVVLPDPEKAVSRFHAELRYENGTYVLVDASSPNGIWLNGARVPEIELRPGVEAVIGTYILKVEDAANITETVAISAPTVLSNTPQATRQEETLGAITPAKTQIPKSSKTQPPQLTTSKRSSMSSNSLWFGVAALLLIATTVAIVVGVRRHAQTLAHNRAVAAEQERLAQNEAEARQREAEARQRHEQIRQWLLEAQSLLEDSKFDEAREKLDRVNELDPSNVDAAQLLEKVQVAFNSPKVSSPVSPPPKKIKDDPKVQQGGSQQPDPKAKALQDRYEQGKQALLNGDYATAVKLLEIVVRDDPRYLDAQSLLDDSRTRLRDATQAAAVKAEVAGEWQNALKLYGDAQRFGAANSEDQNRVRLTMQKAGTDAFNRAKQYYAFGQFENALPLYRRAYQLLPEADPNRKIAQDRIEAITSRGRGLRGASVNDK